MGGGDALKEYHEKAQAVALDFIKEDQKQVSKVI